YVRHSNSPAMVEHPEARHRRDKLRSQDSLSRALSAAMHSLPDTKRKSIAPTRADMLASETRRMPPVSSAGRSSFLARMVRGSSALGHVLAPIGAIQSA